MLKKLTSSLLLFACACVYASAAEDSTDKLRAADPLPFSQGWFAGAGLGANIGADGLKGDNPEFSIGLPGMHLYAGKWITPAFGLRFGIQGLHAAGFYGADGYEFLAAPVDLMVNIPSLLIPSLKKTPFDFSLYLSAVPAWGLPSGYYAFGVGGGLQASYSFNDNWAAFADARGSIIGQNITGILNQGIFATAAVSVGAQYSFSLGKKALTPEVAAQDAKASEQAAPEIPQEVPAGEPAPGIAETAVSGINEPAPGSGVVLGEYTGGVKGVIVNRTAKSAVEGARVKLYSGASELATVVTDAEGNFSLQGVPDGMYSLVIEAPEFYANQVNVTVNDGYMKNMFKLSLTPSQVIENADDASLQEFDMDDSGYNDSPTVLFGSNDIFASLTSFNFSAVRYRQRGYANESQEVYLAGVKMNDALTGYGPFSLWSGLNEGLRAKESVSGSEIFQYGFGGYNGATQFFGNASSVRKGLRASVLTNSALYRLRLMLSYGSGQLDNGWSYAFNVSARMGGNDWVDGVYYRSFAYFGAVEKKLGDKHTLGLVTFATPGQRGAQNGSTQEVYDLMGDNMYNSNWGYQNGKVRNSRVRKTFEPVTYLTWKFVPSDDLEVNATLLWRTGKNGYTALDWYDASDPRPDYYRNLPSYFFNENPDYNRLNPQKAAWAREVWTHSGSYRDLTHLNWDRLYTVNSLSDDGNGRLRSKYVQEERHIDQNDLNFAARVKWNALPWMKVNGGVNAKINRTEYYKTIADLLGGDYFVNIDNFAERDFAVNQEALQNDLDYYYAHGSAQKVKKGDKYGYDYYAQVRNAGLWANAELSRGNLSGNIGARIGTQASWRDGLWKKGLFPDNSKGKSDKASFITGGVKANASYSIGGKMRVFANFGWFADAPTFTQSFVSPRTRNTMVDGLKTVKTLTTDLNWQYFSNGYNVKLTGFFSTMKDGSKVMSFYDDLQNAFTNFSMTGIDQRHMGVELAFRVPLPIANLALQGVFAYGNYIYTSTPRMTQTVDNSETVTIKDEPVTYWKSHTDVDGKTVKHYVAGTPQLATSLGLSWNKNYWFVDADVEYFGNSYLDMNPLYRTRYATTGPDGYESPLEVDYMASQEKFPGFFLLNASVGKSWYIHYKYQLGFSLSAKNLLNNTEVRTGGYEQTRLVDNTVGKERYYRFDSKYFYMSGFNYMLNIYFRF
ncbi:MAG: DUF2012 domain-containing protein [Bacteroidales bacterium]|nr:DUF2012 domain-containing protein [Bacteroidales bacterium]